MALRKNESLNAAGPAGRVAVIDIGSNTVRLVVYDTPTRLPVPMFNEKAQCELGWGMAETGRLNPEGIDLALSSLERFFKLAEAMGVERMDMVATAAVRDAGDGADFTAEVERRFGVPVQVLSGAEEARLAALGLLSGVPGADGLLGDMGGGSLDLVAIDDGSFAGYATLQLGHLRLAEETGNKPKRAPGIVAGQLSTVPFLKEIKGRALYAVGGSWRAIASIFIEQSRYPLHVIDGYTLERREALKMTHLIAAMGPQAIQRIPGIQRRRAESLPYAAAALEALIEASRPRRVIFSGFGMREGQLLKGLAEELRGQDPLISGCATLAEHSGRFSIRGEEIMAWISPLFPDETPNRRRLRLAACLLADIGWSEHPDYRAEHAFHRVLRLPFAGLTHADRVLLAEAVFVRYNGDPWAALVAPVRNLLNEEQLAWGQVVGLALRFAHTLSGSAPGLLSRIALRIEAKSLVLELPGDIRSFASETVERRFKTLARALDLKALISGQDN